MEFIFRLGFVMIFIKLLKIAKIIRAFRVDTFKNIEVLAIFDFG